MQDILSLSTIIRKYFLLVKCFARKYCYNNKKRGIFMLRIKELRLENEKTQEKMAKILGVSRQVYANYENEINEPSIEMLIKMSQFFQCSIDYLIGNTDDFGNVSIQNTAPALSSDEQRLIDTYRRLNAKNRIHVSAYADVRLEEQSKS